MQATTLTSTPQAASVDSMSGKKSSAEKRKEKKDALIQMHCKIRALDMINNYLSHTPTISNVLVLSITVIKALENVSKEKSHASLERRLNGPLMRHFVVF